MGTKCGREGGENRATEKNQAAIRNSGSLVEGLRYSTLSAGYVSAKPALASCDAEGFSSGRSLLETGAWAHGLMAVARRMGWDQCGRDMSRVAPEWEVQRISQMDMVWAARFLRHQQRIANV